MASTIGGSAINFNRQGPVIDYTSLDYESLRDDLITWAASTYSDRWTDFNPTQFAVVFLDMTAYFGDLTSFYLNAGLREVALLTAQRRKNVETIARGYGYTLRSASRSSAAETIVSNGGSLPYAMPAATTKFGAGSVIFQPDQDYTITTTPQTIQVKEGEQFITQALGTSNGIQNQTFQVPNAPVIDGTLIVQVAGVPWTKVDTFSTAAPSDQVYRALVDDDGNTTVYFSDGVNGKIPPVSVAITASYVIGGGVRGRVGANTITSILSAPAGTLSVTNPAMAIGGEDQETIEQARSAVPASLSAGDRAVTLVDFASVARKASSSVAKAMAYQVDTRTVGVVIVPAGGGFATDALKNEVATFVRARAMNGTRVQMRDPFYVTCAVNIDLLAVKAAQVGDVAVAARSLFLTDNPVDTQNGLFDFDNVGFGARADDGDPTLTRDDIVATIKRALASRGVQGARLNKLTTIPALKPKGFTNSTDAALTWVQTAGESDELVRRRWRIQFSSPTVYTVTEGISGWSTQLTKSVLTDDRAQFPSLVTVAALLNPNTNYDIALAVNEALSTDTALRLALASDDLYTYAVPGDPYRVEWPATPGTGTVGVAYTPTKLDGDPHGFSWTVTGTGFQAGDQYYVDVFALVDDLVLDFDEIPQLSSANLVINIRNAY